jgi:hypothetical protein
VRKIFSAVILLTGFMAACAVPAAVTVTINETGPNVVVSATGTLSTTGLTGPNNGNLCFSDIRPSTAVLTVGAHNTPCVYYSGASILSAFGAGTGSGLPDTSSGYFATTGGFIYLPTGFVSGGSINASATYLNKSLATLGLTPGTYNVTWSGDTITFIVQSASANPIPTLGEWAMIFMASLMAMFGMRRMRRSK